MTESAPSRRADDRPVRLALVLGGRASAGAYAAGAASEILAALDRSRTGRVELAVVCGTSAGALSAAVGARAMTVNPGLLPFLENLWVDALDVRHLLEPGGRGTAGIFRHAPLLELGAALIAADPASDDRRARGVAEALSLGMTLANLNGVPLRRRFRFHHAADRTCDVRVHRDTATFRLGAATDAADPVWEVVRDAALASMAIPFVLPPVELDRGKLSHPDARLREASGSGRMWFADGDWLAHEPIRLARRLARSSPGAEEADWRYIVVDPHLEDTGDESVRPDTRIGVARAVARATLGRGADHDWIATAETNARVELFESLVRRLPEVAEGLMDPDALGLGREIARLAEVAAENDVARDGIDDEEAALERLDAELDRIGRDPRFAPALERTGTRAGRTRLAKLIYILESAGDLRDRTFLTLHRVGPRSGERLAGASLGHLGGFLEREWRAADFEAGRRDAARLLSRHFSDLLSYEKDPDAIQVPDPGDTSYGGASPASRALVERWVDREARRALDAVRPALPFRLLGWLWKPALRRWARQRVRESLEGRATTRGG